MSFDLHRLAGVGLVALAGLLGLLTLVWLLQRRLIYMPFPSAVPPIGEVLPNGTELPITTDDGIELGGWLVPGSGERGRTTFVVFNGNAGNRWHRVPLARGLQNAGFSVLLFDYRGYGGNRGRPSEQGLLRDARAVVQALDEQEHLPASRRIYFGESLGAAVAIALAVEHPPAALVLRSPFSTLADVGRFHYPLLPVRTLLRDRFLSIERITRVQVPVLFVVGDHDRVVPPNLSRRLYDVASSPKHYVVVSGADHNDMTLLAGDELIAECVALADSLL